MRTHTRVKKRKGIKLIAFIIVVGIIAAPIALYYVKVASPLVRDIAAADVKAQTIAAYIAANERISKLSAFYGEFFTYQTNEEGEITLAHANSAGINSLSIAAQREMQKSVDEITASSIKIPIGAFTGLVLFADKGEKIDITITPVGTVDVKINSYYYSSGINQTLHRLVMRVQTTINMLIPIKSSDIVVAMDFILAENVLVGRVPDSYITGIAQDNVFDLLP